MKVKEIILHCSATVEGKTFTAADIDKWHKKQGWKKIGYHYVIDLDGTIEQGRLETENGAHCLNHNSTALGICYIGGVDKDNKPKDTRTVEQKESLCKLVFDLMGKYNLNLEQIHCHNEFANKACPSFTIAKFRNDYLKWIDGNEKH